MKSPGSIYPCCCKVLLTIVLLIPALHITDTAAQDLMMFGDTSRTGSPFSKDPHVIWFGGRYLMYYSVQPYSNKDNPVKGWGIGIAQSYDLVNWTRVAEISPEEEYESKGLCAPCARVISGRVHLFYQTYGNGRNDAICHAVSDDGIIFIRDRSNPVFHPDGSWNCGRAIDAELVFFKGKYFLYYATRDPGYKIQMLGVASAAASTDFSKNDWKNVSDSKPVLAPALDWEKDCIEGATVIEKKGRLYMFYAGAYNNAPQQVGVAVSSDGIKWERLSRQPFLATGKPGEWNSSESGHPHIFEDKDGRTFLFFQGNNDKGKTWFISKIEVGWTRKGPFLKK
ncbi:MAG: family 43 glycosylhydrolase [Bacteroidales bacterium]